MKKKHKTMKRIGPGSYRGHAPENQTPEEKAELAEQDRKQLEWGEAVRLTLLHNIEHPRD